MAGQKLQKKAERRALAYLDQARDFYEAASNPRLGSKPLLYYYAFLNLAKYALVVSGVSLPQKIQHGISDPKVNSKQQIKFSGQKVQWNGRATDRSELFAELLTMLHGQPIAAGARTIKALLRQIPTIHRTFCLVTDEKNAFLPIDAISVKHSGGQMWAVFCIKKSDADADKILERISKRAVFKKLMTRVRSDKESEIWFESPSVPGAKKGIDNGIRALAQRLRPLGLGAILTGTGYRFYFTDISPSHRLPQLAVSYAVMFYLGSLTRYRPNEFERIVDGGENWIVGEFFATQPSQVIHLLCSFLSGRAVHRPYAV